MKFRKTDLLLLFSLICFALYFVGCTASAEAKKKEPLNLEYFKDDRTNLCFVRNVVYNSNGFADDVFTNVPCTAEVERLIQ